LRDCVNFFEIIGCGGRICSRPYNQRLDMSLLHKRNDNFTSLGLYSLTLGPACTNQGSRLTSEQKLRQKLLNAAALYDRRERYGDSLRMEILNPRELGQKVWR